jgi:CRISPR-associated endonuclease/helicase Cas3
MHQAFDTAGELFEAIGKGGLDVIVPYVEGKNLIAELCAEPDLRELPGLIRRAQRFTVHLFDGERRKLNDLGAIRILPDSGAAVLLEGFYHPDLGVQTRRAEMDALFG